MTICIWADERPTKSSMISSSESGQPNSVSSWDSVRIASRSLSMRTPSQFEDHEIEARHPSTLRGTYSATFPRVPHNLSLRAQLSDNHKRTGTGSRTRPSHGSTTAPITSASSDSTRRGPHGERTRLRCGTDRSRERRRERVRQRARRPRPRAARSRYELSASRRTTCGTRRSPHCRSLFNSATWLASMSSRRRTCTRITAHQRNPPPGPTASRGRSSTRTPYLRTLTVPVRLGERPAPVSVDGVDRR